ncbi:MAG TPA: MFS transporter [Gaiellaceae bacterium]|nr:MFS transporter [Gaiellaceae bacterium]
MDAPAAPLRRNRDFLLLWTGQAASVLGTRTASVAYPLLALALTHSAVDAGLLAFFGRLPWFAFTLFAGAIADRADRKMVMLASDVVAAAAMTSVAAALIAGALTLSHLFAAAFAEGTAFIFMHVCQPGALRRIVPAEQVPDAIARAEAREYGTSLAGPPLGGVLYGLARSLPFGVNAISYLFSFASVLLIRTRLVDDAPAPREPVLREIREGIRWLWHQPFLRASLLLVGLVNFFSNGVSFVLVVVVRQHGGSAALIGTMLAISSVGGLLGALAAPRLRRLLPRRLVVLSIMWVGAAVSVPLAAVAPHALALGTIVALVSFIGPTWNAVVDGYRISIVPDRLQGRVSSVDALLAFSAIPLAPLVAGVLIEAIGGTKTLLAFGALMLAVAVTGSASRGLQMPAEAPATN